MGELLTERNKNEIPAAAVRDFLQMIRNCFPVYQVIARNTHQLVSETCPLCKLAAESYQHMQMGCKQTKDVWMTFARDGITSHEKSAIFAGRTHARLFCTNTVHLDTSFESEAQTQQVSSIETLCTTINSARVQTMAV